MVQILYSSGTCLLFGETEDCLVKQIILIRPCRSPVTGISSGWCGNAHKSTEPSRVWKKGFRWRRLFEETLDELRHED